jgi:hypothetical protein
MKEKKTIRKNVTLKNELAKWLEESAEYMGVSQSAFIVMVLMEYRRNTAR